MRQQLEQVIEGLERLAATDRGILALLEQPDRDDVSRLSVRLDEYQQGYVMNDQRVTHDTALSSMAGGEDDAAIATPAGAATAEDPVSGSTEDDTRKKGADSPPSVELF